MPAPVNQLKKNLAEGQLQTGCWLGLADAYATEIAGTAGFDWLLIDGEHAPNDINLISQQIGTLQNSSSSTIVRVPIGEDWILKRVLDAGAQTIMVPMVETGEQAADMARAMLYPPHGVRGVGSALGRSSQFSGIADYLTTADAQVCLIAQVESANALRNLDDICAVDGVDCVFIGPADLAADMGYLGKANAPEVLEAIENAIKTIVASGKSAGILAVDPKFAAQSIAWGATFVGVAIDVLTLANGLRATAKAFKQEA